MVDTNDVLEGLNSVEKVLDGLWAKTSNIVDSVFSAALAWVDAKRVEVLDSDLDVSADEVDLTNINGEGEPEPGGSEIEDVSTLLEQIRESAASFVGSRTEWDNFAVKSQQDVDSVKQVHEVFVASGLWDVSVKDLFDEDGSGE